jgi:hypothetical protein
MFNGPGDCGPGNFEYIRQITLGWNALTHRITAGFKAPQEIGIYTISFYGSSQATTPYLCRTATAVTTGSF